MVLFPVGLEAAELMNRLDPEWREAWRRVPLGVRLAVVVLRLVGMASLFVLLLGLLLAIQGCVYPGSVDGDVRAGSALLGISWMVAGFLVIVYAAMRGAEFLADGLVLLRGDRPEAGADWPVRWLNDLLEVVPAFAIGYAVVQGVVAAGVQLYSIPEWRPASLTVLVGDAVVLLGVGWLVRWRKRRRAGSGGAG